MTKQQQLKNSLLYPGGCEDPKPKGDYSNSLHCARADARTGETTDALTTGTTGETAKFKAGAGRGSPTVIRKDDRRGVI